MAAPKQTLIITEKFVGGLIRKPIIRPNIVSAPSKPLTTK